MTPTRDPNRPKVPEVAPLVRALYASPGGGAGCCLHVVLDDNNVDDASVRGCLDLATQRGHQRCVELATALLRMTRTQRKRVGP